MPVLTPQQISEVNATTFRQRLTGVQLQKFNDLILSDKTSPYQVVETMRQHDVSRDTLPALKSPECKTKYIAVLQADHEKEWQNILPQTDTASISAIDNLEGFVADWEAVGNDFTGPHIEDAKNKIEEMKGTLAAGFRQQEEAEWQRILSSNESGLGKIKAIISHITKWKANGVETHVNDADKEVWETILNIDSKDLITALKKYLGTFDGNTFANGEHKIEAEETINSYPVWKTAKKKRDIFEVHNFIFDYPASLFVPAAKALRSELKAEEIARMKTLMDEYPVDRLLALLNQNIFTEDELLEKDVATQEGLKTLRNLERIKNNLPDLVDVQARCNTSCAPNRTDIYLFGTPATGKTCILMGLIGANTLNANFATGAGEYAQALRLYRTSGLLPGQTVENFVATIQASISVNKEEHRINLVELAGEDFAINVANGQNGNIDFAQMGEGVPALLANNNRKVFFLIVDPTSETVKVQKTIELKDRNGNPIIDQSTGLPQKAKRMYVINQYNSLQTMINMLASPKNVNVMRKVDAVHIIVTKSDKLGGENERGDKAYELFMGQYQQLIHPLTQLCRQYGINQHSNKDLNGVSRLFSFSLGKFYPGGYYQYNDTDAKLLIKTISKCTVAIRPKTIWDRFCDVMDKSVL